MRNKTPLPPYQWWIRAQTKTRFFFFHHWNGGMGDSNFSFVLTEIVVPYFLSKPFAFTAPSPWNFHWPSVGEVWIFPAQFQVLFFCPHTTHPKYLLTYYNEGLCIFLLIFAFYPFLSFHLFIFIVNSKQRKEFKVPMLLLDKKGQKVNAFHWAWLYYKAASFP